ncbi:protein adenylyltransferase SelO [Paludibacterium paludis]|uniref:Protein nucleotidyltransferase YdiU n=1 Tax=Paludibacterium paludis TaxID=1225769 RepID=A0A918NY42_9NEIS|nr:YdiU family protein [Paludibacterium paludis]GGY06189.1 UPF0061 protein [Paludibacterium paludis]
MTPFASVNFGRRLEALPGEMLRRVRPQPLPDPYAIAINRPLARELGIDPDSLLLPDALAVLAGNRVPDGAQPLATCYSGHQFGQYVPQLGDGRALLLGDTPWRGERAEWQLKGAGMTPFSRMGDGRAVLRSSVREYLCSEAMHGLGIPTTRALALVGSPERVMREMPETAAVVTRIAESFLRFGHFEVAYHRGMTDATRALAAFLIEHHYPECRDREEPVLALFERIVERTAGLMAAWQSVGFCHGVMNTDNMSLLGLTLDYGPFGFLDDFDAGHICNHSDHSGRYAFGEQPRVALWNLYCLGSAFLPLASEAALVGVLERYSAMFETEWLARLRQKLGWRGEETGDVALIEALFALLQEGRADYTLFFRTLADVDEPGGADRLAGLFATGADIGGWLEAWRRRAASDGRGMDERKRAMHGVNPRFVLRNHLAELAIRAARDEGNFAPIARLAECLARPFDEQPENSDLAGRPPEWAREISVSCSS